MIKNNYFFFLQSKSSCDDDSANLNDMAKQFLDIQVMSSSPSANYYQPNDEPEPWDLTQLNVEASVMCLVSKVLKNLKPKLLIFSNPYRNISAYYAFFLRFIYCIFHLFEMFHCFKCYVITFIFFKGEIFVWPLWQSCCEIARFEKWI